MLLVLTVLLTAQPKEDYPALHQRFQHGNYAEARTGYQELLRGERPAVAAFVGLAAIDRAEGEYEKSLETLGAGLKFHADDPALLAHRADLLFSLGRWDDASRDAEAAIKKEDATFLGRWVRTRILR
ncbi:MAG TPA: hypothetical protein VLM40_21990, partial [Gemmata sp.]|nr:hypothetical protein [Gemmata sp.]